MGAADAWGQHSMAGNKASRTASAHASRRCRAVDLDPMAAFDANHGPGTPVGAPATGAYSQNAQPRCMSRNSGSSKSIRPS